MDSLSTGKNMCLHDEHTAVWKDQTSHLFVSKCFDAKSLPIYLEYKGTGHFFYGLSGSDGKYIRKYRTKVKNDHGKICFGNNGQEIVLSIDKEEKHKQEWSEIERKAQGHSTHICFDLRFGDVKINLTDKENKNHFVSLNGNGMVNGKQIRLKTPQPDCEVAYNMPLSTCTFIQIEITPVKIASWWEMQMFLSNTPPSGQISMPSDKFRIPFSQKNPNGVITLCMTSDGKVTYTFRDSKETKKIEKIHLSKDVYLWFTAFRCKIHVTSTPKEDTPKVAYVETMLVEEESYSQPIQATDDEQTTPKEADVAMLSHSDNAVLAEKELKNIERFMKLAEDFFKVNSEPCCNKMLKCMQETFDSKFQR